MNQPPEHLDGLARQKWGEVLEILDGRGDTLDAGTLDALSCYAVAWSQWTSAQAQVQQLGTVVKSPAGFAVESPYLAVARKAQAELRRWGAELKLTPRSRGKADAPGPDAEELRAAIIEHIGKTFDAEVKALKKEIKLKKSYHSYAGQLENELADVQARGIEWQSACLLDTGANSTAVCRALATLETEGLLTCHKPAGRTTHVKLTPRGLEI